MKKYEYDSFPGFRRNYIKDFFIYPLILEEFWHTLSGSEQKVLCFILRQTIGFRKTCDFITLKQFATGIGGKSKNKGTGLSTSQIRRAIVLLEEKGFIHVHRSYRKPSNFCLVLEKLPFPNEYDPKSIPAFKNFKFHNEQ